MIYSQEIGKFEQRLGHSVQQKMRFPVHFSATFAKDCRKSIALIKVRWQTSNVMMANIKRDDGKHQTCRLPSSLQLLKDVLWNGLLSSRFRQGT